MSEIIGFGGSISTSFLKMHTRTKSHMGLVMEGDKQPSYGKDYSYLDIPVSGLWNGSEEKLVDKGLRNQYLKVLPACKLNVQGQFKVLVEPNPRLAEWGIIQPSYYLNPGELGEVVPGFHIHLRRDLDIGNIDYAVRLYLRN